MKRRRAAANTQPEMRDGILVRHCHELADFEACIEVERAVWKGADLDVVPVPLFVIAAETGGEVLGAFEGDRMVGFTMAIAGWKNRKPFLHSHMTAVLDGYRDRGLGRRLKFFQRQDALSRGIRLVEWTFDPLETKNAYFNLMRLGAIARRYLPNVYGITTSPLHAGLPTDRLVAEWHLDSPRVRRILAGKAPILGRGRKTVRISVPAGDGGASLPRQASLPPQVSPERAAERARAQTAIREQFQHWFAKGYAATAIGRSDASVDYILEPWKK